MTRHYFAYGSNMNPARVEQRKMQFARHHGGVLKDYRLAFNKRSQKYPGAASANVMPVANDCVEGVLYELTHPRQIETMDPFEGYPILYDRVALPVHYNDGVIDAWVYIANAEFIAEGLKPARWYLEHLLKGEPHLSRDYFTRLVATECLPGSDMEPP